MRLQETCLQSPAKPHDVLADFFERNRTFNLDDPFGAELHFNFEAGPRFNERSYVIRNADYLRNVSVRTSTSERSDGVNKAPVPTRTTALAVSALRHALRHTVNSWRKQKLVAGQSAWSNWHCGWSRASTCSGRRRSSRYATSIHQLLVFRSSVVWKPPSLECRTKSGIDSFRFSGFRRICNMP